MYLVLIFAQSNVNRRAILTQQNSIGSPRSPLSPQNSIRSGMSRQPSLRGRVSQLLFYDMGSYKQDTSKIEWIYFNQYVPDCWQTSMHGSIPERDFKTNNLNELSKVESGSSHSSGSGDGVDAASDAATDVALPYKICGYFEPKGCFADRDDYSLYIFSQTNM